MNERIQECWIKAAREDSDPDNWDTQEQFIERFAKLIVKECLGCCEQVISDPVPESVDTFEQGGIYCIDEIRHHFGVEE